MDKKNLNNKQKTSPLSEKQKKRFELIETKRKHFVENIYPHKSKEEKILYWSGYIRDCVRSWAEYRLFDATLLFNQEEYRGIQEHEPDFDNLLPEILNTAHVDFPDELVYKRIRT